MSNKRGHHRRSGQNYERTDRVSGLVKEIVAGELERIDDSRLFLVSITGVDVDRELANATVWFYISDEEDLEVVADALEQHRQRAQQALARQSRMRRTPTIHFAPDTSIHDASRIESILDELGMGDSETQTKTD
ncbi:MAG TPA: 30S ribosome-binding factor RbfA [Acidimicrobiaceae bacterium]|jgi:ribosome-binding factor A|nr:30S ribosome-binding factor RbfA [Acidimicrobiaceae bacterium]